MPFPGPTVISPVFFSCIYVSFVVKNSALRPKQRQHLIQLRHGPFQLRDGLRRQFLGSGMSSASSSDSSLSHLKLSNLRAASLDLGQLEGAPAVLG